MIKQILDYLVENNWMVNSKFNIDDSYTIFGYYELSFGLDNQSKVPYKTFSFLDVKYVSLDFENKSVMIELADPWNETIKE